MDFTERLLQLRRENGLSQEQLANKLDVTRQTISNWELGVSTPELNKITSMANIFNVSTDYLLCIQTDYSKNRFHYEYKSKKELFGMPLIHINVGPGLKKARGIVAIGNVSFGLLSIGGVSLGLISLGGLGLGLLSLAGLSIALLCGIGGIALAPVAIGGVAIGIFSIGGLAIGKYAIGGCAFASEIGYGAYPTGKAAIKTDCVNTKEDITQLIEQNTHGVSNWIKNIFIMLGK